MLDGDADVLVLDLKAQAVEDAHIHIGYPHQCKPGDDVAAPSCIDKLEAQEQQCEGRDVVRKTILASEEIEELFLWQ